MNKKYRKILKFCMKMWNRIKISSLKNIRQQLRSVIYRIFELEIQYNIINLKKKLICLWNRIKISLLKFFRQRFTSAIHIIFEQEIQKNHILKKIEYVTLGSRLVCWRIFHNGVCDSHNFRTRSTEKYYNFWRKINMPVKFRIKYVCL